jgi:hypothetical protein
MINTEAAPGVQTRAAREQIGARTDDYLAATHLLIARHGLPRSGRRSLP